ncbi:uncharacterized protein LOC126575663 [Anopheles aquasalis]|uniref:uncharacterized protein LOC126575663 n=1 Tax=Anopheles aquasalis TaxID=42839 RepID=UPI00215ADA4F|nr:uncharacterized protein LOC126575663 [Anopheles aquasalis]
MQKYKQKMRTKNNTKTRKNNHEENEEKAIGRKWPTLKESCTQRWNCGATKIKHQVDKFIEMARARTDPPFGFLHPRKFCCKNHISAVSVYNNMTSKLLTFRWTFTPTGQRALPDVSSAAQEALPVATAAAQEAFPVASSLKFEDCKLELN